MASSSDNYTADDKNPVKTLIDYVNDIKPYHTKIVDVLVEYVSNDDVKTVISEREKFNLSLRANPIDLTTSSCGIGYGAVQFGDPSNVLILSPNHSISNFDYPAINPSKRQLIVSGNRTKDIIIGSHMDMVSYVDNIEHIYPISAVSSNSVSVSDINNTFNLYHQVGNSIYAIDSGFDYIELKITSIAHNGSTTVVGVSQTIPTENYEGGYLGIVRTYDSNTKRVTITNVEYSNGFIDSWPGYPDENTYIFGDSPHTIITVAEQLYNPIITTQYDKHQAYLRFTPMIVEKVFPYDGVNLYESSEGFLSSKILGNTSSTVRVSGNLQKSNIANNDKVRIVGSTNSNGIYTIDSISYNQVSDESTLTVSESINGTITSGSIVYVIKSNMFVISGNVSSRFWFGKKIKVSSSSFDGIYTVLNSSYDSGYTLIRVIESIIPENIGDNITNIGSSGFNISGDATQYYKVGDKFVVMSSYNNNYSYTVNSINYNSITDTTNILPNEFFIADSTSTGRILRYDGGLIVSNPMGLDGGGNTQLSCAKLSNVASVIIKDSITMRGVVLSLKDNIIAYNLENLADGHGYGELPLYTIISQTAPIVHTTQPINPNADDLWFNQTTNQLMIYKNVSWFKIIRAFWANPLSGQVFYRVVSNNIDTGWILYLAELPGYGSIQAANPITNANAYVNELDAIPHRIIHSNVTGLNTALVIHGGDFLNRFNNSTTFNVWNISNANSQNIGVDVLSVVKTDQSYIYISGEFDWLFVGGCYINCTLSNGDMIRLEVISSSSYFDNSLQVPAIVTKINVGRVDVSAIIGVVYSGGSNIGGVSSDRTIIIPKNYSVNQYDQYVIDYIWVGPIRFNIFNKPVELVNPSVDENIDLGGALQYNKSGISESSKDVYHATVSDKVSFTWGIPLRWNISGISPDGYTITIPKPLNGLIYTGDIVKVISSDLVTISSNVVGVSQTGNTTQLTLSNQIVVSNISATWILQLDNADVTDWFNYIISKSDHINSTITVLGNVTTNRAFQPGKRIMYIGESGKSMYTIQSTSYNFSDNVSNIVVIESVSDNMIGSIGPHRTHGIRLILSDSIGVGMVENTSGYSLDLNSGNIIDSWDYSFWDMGPIG